MRTYPANDAGQHHLVERFGGKCFKKNNDVLSISAVSSPNMWFQCLRKMHHFGECQKYRNSTSTLIHLNPFSDLVNQDSQFKMIKNLTLKSKKYSSIELLKSATDINPFKVDKIILELCVLMVLCVLHLGFMSINTRLRQKYLGQCPEFHQFLTI